MAAVVTAVSTVSAPEAAPATEDWVATAIEAYRTSAKAAEDPADRKDKMDQLYDEATYAYRTGDFDEALQHFAQHLAIHEVEVEEELVSVDVDLHAGDLFNIGACLHLLGENDDLARQYYTRARDSFSSVKVGRLRRWFFGDSYQEHAAYIQSRLEMLANGQKPDTSKYLDSNGHERAWVGEARMPGAASVAQKDAAAGDDPTAAAEEGASAKSASLPEEGASPDDISILAHFKSYFSPSAWGAWYRGETPFVKVQTEDPDALAELEFQMKHDFFFNGARGFSSRGGFHFKGGM